MTNPRLAAALTGAILLVAGCGTSSSSEGTPTPNGPSAVVSPDEASAASAVDPDRTPQERLGEAIGTGDTVLVLALIDAGADIEADVDGVGGTALHLAAANGTPEVLQALIDLGADLEAVSGQGAMTPQILAVQNRRPDNVGVLMAAGANDAALMDGMFARGAIHLAAGNNGVESLMALIAGGASRDLLDSRHEATALFNATFADHIEAFDHLVGQGSDPWFIANNGNNPVDAAYVGTSPAMIEYLEGAGFVANNH